MRKPTDTASTASATASSAALDQSRLEHLVGYAASRASLELRKVFASNIGPLGLKVVEFSILMLVASNPQVNQKQLGRTLDVSAPNMAVILDRMAARGWVERVRSQQDRRVHEIHLTAAGRELVQRAGRIAEVMEEPALAMLSPAERALLIELLMKIAGGTVIAETGTSRERVASLAPVMPEALPCNFQSLANKPMSRPPPNPPRPERAQQQPRKTSRSGSRS
jgi:DNA-binding MarR family transcriptional regulator